MEINELSWVMQNRHLLTEEETEKVASYNLFEQFEAGEIHQNGAALIEVFALIQELFDRYNTEPKTPIQ